jgi:hypothetical protein
MKKLSPEPGLAAKTDSLVIAPPASGRRAKPLIKFLRFISEF